jgi:biotin carboxyl carrier protein
MQQKIKVVLDGVEKEVTAETIEKKLWFKIDDRIYSYDLIDLAEGHHKRAGATSKSPDKITAPMPGKITKVFVSENQTVKKGDALLVMEAMKMEYTLKAGIEAQVEKVFSVVGDQVTLGHLLIQLKEIK